MAELSAIARCISAGSLDHPIISAASQPLGSPADAVDEHLLAGELAALKITNQLLLAVGRAPTLAEVPDIVAQAAALVDEAPLAEAIYVATAKAAMLGADDSDIEAEDETVIAPDRFARWTSLYNSCTLCGHDQETTGGRASRSNTRSAHGPEGRDGSGQHEAGGVQRDPSVRLSFAEAQGRLDDTASEERQRARTTAISVSGRPCRSVYRIQNRSVASSTAGLPRPLPRKLTRCHAAKPERESEPAASARPSDSDRETAPEPDPCSSKTADSVMGDGSAPQSVRGKVDGEPDPCSGDILGLGAQTTQAINGHANVSEEGSGSPYPRATEPASTPAAAGSSHLGVDAAGEPCSGASTSSVGPGSPVGNGSEARNGSGPSGFCGVDGAAAPCSSAEDVTSPVPWLPTPVVRLGGRETHEAGGAVLHAAGLAHLGVDGPTEPCSDDRCAGEAGPSVALQQSPPVRAGAQTSRATTPKPRPGWKRSGHSYFGLAARAGRPGSKSFTDAVVEFRSRGAVTRDVFDAMTAEERARSFTVARMLTDKSVAVVQDELARAIEAGESLRKFRVNLRQRMQSSGIAIAPHWRSRGDDATLDALDASHVETVYRNGVMSAYSAGRAKHMTQPHIVAARPYWQVMTVNDGPPRQRPTHQAVHGWVMRADDPGWQTTYYPAGHS